MAEGSGLHRELRYRLWQRISRQSNLVLRDCFARAGVSSLPAGSRRPCSWITDIVFAPRRSHVAMPKSCRSRTLSLSVTGPESFATKYGVYPGSAEDTSSKRFTRWGSVRSPSANVAHPDFCGVRVTSCRQMTSASTACSHGVSWSYIAPPQALTDTTRRGRRIADD